MQFPILSVIIFLPLIAGLLILAIRLIAKLKSRRPPWLQQRFHFCSRSGYSSPTTQTVAGYQFSQKFDWLPALGISYYVGVDGLEPADGAADRHRRFVRRDDLMAGG